jgi:4a-hydroxytetrahydrobiopterin dehydratase
LLSEHDVTRWLEDHPIWRVDDNHLVAFIASEFDLSVRILVDVVPEIERLNHHPRVEVAYEGLTIELWTHDRGGITHLDLDVASFIDDIAFRIS